MNDHAEIDAVLAEPTLRKQVKQWIDRHCLLTGMSHSSAWRRAYAELEARTSFRGPDKKTLDAIEQAGLMAQMLEGATSLCSPCGDHAAEVNSSIPDYIPCEG